MMVFQTTCVAAREGLEPPTFALGKRCSILLSYRADFVKSATWLPLHAPTCELGAWGARRSNSIDFEGLFEGLRVRVQGPSQHIAS
jgi:hypothetical protein